MEKGIHNGHRERLRDMAKKHGITKMQQHQAMELLLTYVIPQKDVNPTAHLLINTFGSFAAVLDASIEDLQKVKGIGEKTAHFLSSLKEFFYLYKEQEQNELPVIKNTNDAVTFMANKLKYKLHEELYVLCIDGNNKVKKCEQISKGGVNFTELNMRKMLEVVFSSNTHNVILFHNHPSGPSNPSPADNKLTKSALMALVVNNINLLDHIIIAKDNFYSYNRSGDIAVYYREVGELINQSALMQNACSYNN